MLEEIRYEGGFINKVYHSPYREEEKSVFRKPKPGMARKAKIDFPEIDFKKSVMIGDALTDMEFGKNLGMVTIFIADSGNKKREEHLQLIDMTFPDLISIAKLLTHP
jgi:HAD superfamily hydrolase (TIGR01662 family)